MLAAQPIDAADARPVGIAPALSRRRKAAMVVQLMITEGRKLDLAALPEEVQVSLTRELGALRLVDRATLSAVATEFADGIEGLGLAAPGGMDRALAALDGRISPATAARLRAESGPPRHDDSWARLTALPCPDLVPLMTGECAEIAAVTLSKLPVVKAAELLGLLPGERARRITHAMAQTSTIGPEAVDRIGAALAAEHCRPPDQAFAHPAPDRLGDILNSSGSATRDAVLDGLEAEDPGFARDVRRAIFTFADIPARLAPAHAPAVLRRVDQAVLITALAAAQTLGAGFAAAAAHLLDNISQRMAQGLRDEISERGAIRQVEGEAAMSEIVAAIRAAAEAGEIALVTPDSDEQAG
ncbi:FliG C-terminal domain-containing protein [Limimaricola hongkongensis]|uniref:Flagellar motor switch protein FliG n=1 Tax=Limimaricola hongkongensis DSM 17492 TaxID=1122180 RepID=A0A017HCZ1_9RHOB|nr:FliG C-terminal domain-containing protein [Limimaricola hongkongensis]EYD71644.1 Flagellar motor switch protein FliG [Limimaricola hongkongensis DSM 17492]